MNVFPATVSVPCRVTTSRIGATVNVTLPGPVPLVLFTRTQLQFARACHPIRSGAVTVIVPVPPALSNVALVGDMLPPSPSCVTVCVCPLT